MSNRKRIRRRPGSLRPFAAIENDTLNSERWKLLSSTEAHVYNMLKSFYRGEKRAFKAPISQLKVRSRIKQTSTLKRAIDGLERKEWIEVSRWYRPGKEMRGYRRRANEYKLTLKYDRIRW